MFLFESDENNYKCLRNQEYKTNEFSIVPIRFADRYKIMRWRNEQIYHLRQSKVLTQLEQDEYFKNVVLNLFDQNKPDQVLFSFLKRKNMYWIWWFSSYKLEKNGSRNLIFNGNNFRTKKFYRILVNLS